MSQNDSLGDRMKTYENVTRFHAVHRMPVIIRLDGKAFHSFTKKFQKPFDSVLAITMQETMQYLCENIQGCVFGYTQSDEISLLLIDYQSLVSSPWFDNTVQKMCSISASMVTMAFNRFFKSNVEKWENNNLAALWENQETQDESTRLTQSAAYEKGLFSALFDSRVFNVPREDVTNYFIWRQQDAIRNSIQALGQACFSHKILHQKNTDEIQKMLVSEKGICWENLPVVCQRGTACRKQMMEVACKNEPEKTIMRKKWIMDYHIPLFTQNMEYIQNVVMPED